MHKRILLALSLIVCYTLVCHGRGSSFFDRCVSNECALLTAPDATARAEAVEHLGYLRAYGAAQALVLRLTDTDSRVRREAALALAWCGEREHVRALIDGLDDDECSVAQAAWVALTNLTGMEFPFDAHAPETARRAQAETWRKWWASVTPGRVPVSVLALLNSSRPIDLARGCHVSATSTYKGPPTVLTDGSGNAFWQTKHVPFPQSCTVDLGAEHAVACVMVTQYGPGHRMTDYSLATSLDGKSFAEVKRKTGPTQTTLVATFPPRAARYVRVVSHAAENPTYPTTFHSVHVYREPVDTDRFPDSDLNTERALRALGALGGEEAASAAVRTITPYATSDARSTPEKLMVQAGIRALGRLGGAEARALLVMLLQHAHWARYAADALGDIGDVECATALMTVYPEFAVSLSRHVPRKLPPDDRPGFEAVDRAYETPYAIAAALDRCRFSRSNAIAQLRTIAPLLVANLAGDFDGAMLYEPEALPQVTGALLDRVGLRQPVCEIAFQALGQPYDISQEPPEPTAQLLSLARQGPGGTSFAATWLAALCREPAAIPRLVALLEHGNGWVRINAAKALMFMDARAAVTRIASLLADSKPEAEHGYFGGFLYTKAKQGQGEYNAPAPCWREAFTRAVGRLGNGTHVPMLTRLLNDERNVLGVQYSAAEGLDQLGTPAAIEAITHAEATHPFHSIRLRCRESLWRRGHALSNPNHSEDATSDSSHGGSGDPVLPHQNMPASPQALVFIRGDNNMPNDFQIDIWRQTYSTTDSGPTYRLGHNLCRLAPVATNGTVTPLTHFTDGYVADCEVSWDGTQIVFARREHQIPWWHIYVVNADGTGLKQLTQGPYHDVQPAYLPDGRIVFSSSRIGYRDEYHGYPATGLTIMNPDGSDVHCIGFNLGRDNEPAVLPDGRIVFSRLELFYSRLKTELTVQAVFPDGTGNETLYGPERREFWRNITRQSGERWWGEAPPRHRVLRMTQPQPLGRNQVICATTGGATVIGPRRQEERVIPRDGNRAVTSPFPLPDGRVLCAATVRTFKRQDVNLGLYVLDTETGSLELVYDDPQAAEFEARPIMARTCPPMRPAATRSAFTAYLLCESALTSREALTRQRGKLLRIVEGQPLTARHHTHTSSAGEAWKNHVGTVARILGTVPLAADGSFYIEIPADRLVHCQVLDSDRRVVGNQLIWMYARPQEQKSCVGCHEMPGTSPIAGTKPFSLSATRPPIACLPGSRPFTYRAKAWQKGRLRDESEERTRTVRAVSLPGRM